MPIPSLSMEQVLGIIGDQELELRAAKAYVAQLEARLAELTEEPAADAAEEVAT